MKILLSTTHRAALQQDNSSIVASLTSALGVKDLYTQWHCESVARLAVKVAEQLNMAPADVEAVRYAALLHDIGKIKIPNHILFKPGPLLPAEFVIIQKHSAIGSNMVCRVPSLRHIAPIILHHHERLDGSGYPYGLWGDAISLPSRIIGAVDAFDAMISQRPYSAPCSAEYAVTELKRGAGTHFDTNVVSILDTIISKTSTGGAASVAADCVAVA